MLLEGKIAVVTGGASPRGIGRATAALFAEHGARVAILDRDGAAARKAAAELGPGHLGFTCDVCDAAACRRAIDGVVETVGPIDVLFNNAGVSQPVRLMEIDQVDWQRILAVSLTGAFNMSQAVVPGMRSRRSGSIVNMSSASAQRGGGIFGGPHYSAAKAGVLGLTKAMARELAPDNIRVNAVCPSLIDTDLVTGLMSEETRRAVLATVPMNRIGSAREVAGCVLFLACDLSSYVTGSEVDVNGGSHIH